MLPNLRTLVLAALSVVAIPIATCADGGVDLVIVTDVSPSMGHADQDAQDRKAGQATLLFQAAQDEHVRVGLVQFTHEITAWLPVQKLPSAPAALDEIVKRFEPPTPNGRTELWKALAMARELLEPARGDSTEPRVRAILLMSDGDFDRVLDFLAGDQPAWRSGGKGAQIWNEVVALRDAGIVLYTIPVTPLIYGKPVDAEKRRKYQAGHDLLDQMAQATNGRSFVRVPGQFEFSQIYNKAFRERILQNPEPKRDAQGRPLVHALHRAVLFTGAGLRGVTLPNGERVDFAKGVPQDEPAAALGTRYTWRSYGSQGMAIFRRPDAPTPAQRTAWEGPWQIHQDTAASSAPVEVVGFSDIMLALHPPLRSSYWPNEVVPIDLHVHSSRLIASPELANWAAPLLNTLECEVELRDEKDQVVARFPGSKHDDQPEHFSLRLHFDRPGQFDAMIRVTTRFRGESHEILRAIVPVRVESQSPLVVTAFRERNEQRDPWPIYDSSAKTSQVGSLRIGDVLVIVCRVAPGAQGVLQEFSPETVPKPFQKYPSRPDQKEDGTEARVIVLDVHPDNAPLQFLAKLLRPDGSKAEVRVSPPQFPISPLDTQRSARLATDERNDERLFVGEQVERSFIIRVEGVAKPEIEAASHIVDVAITDPLLGVLGRRLRAERDSILPAQDKRDDAWDVHCKVAVPADMIRRAGTYAYRVESTVAGLRVNGDGKCRFVASPIWFSLRPKTPATPPDDSVPANEALVATVSVQHPATLEQAWRIELREVENGDADARLVVSQKFERGMANEAIAEIPPLKPTGHALVPVVELTIKLPDEPHGRNVRLHVAESIRLVDRPLQLTARFAVMPSPTGYYAGQHMTTQLVLRVSGGMPHERKDALDGFMTALIAAPRNFVVATTNGAPSLAIDSLQMSPPTFEGNPLEGPAWATSTLSIRITREGDARLAMSPNGGGNPALRFTPFVFAVKPCPYILRVTQPAVSESPLLRSDTEDVATQRIEALAGLPVIASVAFAQNTPDSNNILARFKAVLVWDGHPQDMTDEPPLGQGVRGLGCSAQWTPKEGRHKLNCEVRDSEDAVIAELGPYVLDVQPIGWVYLVQQRLPEYIPTNVDRLLEDLEVRATPTHPDRVPLVRDRLKFQLTLRRGTVTFPVEGTDTEELQNGEFKLTFSRPQLLGGGLRIAAGDEVVASVKALSGETELDANSSAKPLLRFRVTDPAVQLSWPSDAQGEAVQRFLKKRLDHQKKEATIWGVRGTKTIHWKAAWNETVCRKLKVSPDDRNVEIKVLGSDGTSVEARRIGDALRAFDLAPGRYRVQLFADLPRPPASGEEFPGYSVSDEHEIDVVAASLAETPLGIVLIIVGGILVFALVLSLIVAVLKAWHKRRRVRWMEAHRPPSESLGLTLSGDGLDVIPIGLATLLPPRPRTPWPWLVEAFQPDSTWLRPPRTDVYELVLKACDQEPRLRFRIEFAELKGEAYWRRLRDGAVGNGDFECWGQIQPATVKLTHALPIEGSQWFTFSTHNPIVEFGLTCKWTVNPGTTNAILNVKYTKPMDRVPKTNDWSRTSVGSTEVIAPSGASATTLRDV